jgi:hypothetical protein
MCKCGNIGGKSIELIFSRHNETNILITTCLLFSRVAVQVGADQAARAGGPDE